MYTLANRSFVWSGSGVRDGGSPLHTPLPLQSTKTTTKKCNVVRGGRPVRVRVVVQFLQIGAHETKNAVMLTWEVAFERF